MRTNPTFPINPNPNPNPIPNPFPNPIPNPIPNSIPNPYPNHPNPIYQPPIYQPNPNPGVYNWKVNKKKIKKHTKMQYLYNEDLRVSQYPYENSDTNKIF